jgi:predicted amidohydrolase
MDTLGIFCVQRASSLDPAENRAALDVVAEICAGRPRPDLIVFPEVFARDFGKPGSDVGPYAELLDGPFVTRLTELAREHDVTLVAGMFEVSDDPARPFNTLVVVGPEGLRASYRKIHLYDSFGYRESDRLGAGALEPVVVDVKGWQVGLMTCYDLRFPELSRRLVDRGAELLLVPAAWVVGDLKVDHWRTLLRARAIENTVYVAAAAQPAPRYCGHSMVVGPDGQVLAEVADADPDGVLAALDRAHLEAVRETNPSLANRRL